MKLPVLIAGMAMLLWSQSAGQCALDLDSSTVSDVFERVHGVDSPGSDADGDGYTYEEEALLGGDPNVADLLHLSTIENDSPGYQLLSVLDTEGLQYQLQESSDLVSGFTDVSPAVIIVGDGSESIVQVGPYVVDKYFWRWEGIGAYDSQDGDLLDDFEEFLLGTDKLSSDSEPGGGDGMPDDYEFVHMLDPLVDDAGGDKDGDGVINSQDASPNDNAVGALAISVSYPTEGETIN